MHEEIKSDLQRLGSPKKAKFVAGFFKTGPGQYGEGDIFLGITVPKQRDVAKKYLDASIPDLQVLLSSKIHEHRLVALLILVEKFKKSPESEKKRVVDFYLRNSSRVNNWDLVDLSADKILGEYLVDRDRSILYKLAKSGSLWERRIAIVSTFAFIRKNQFGDTFRICEMLMQDRHDLIHKACGWMLREVGKRDQGALEKFLGQHCKKMSRTTLRYSIERLSPSKRKYYMKK